MSSYTYVDTPNANLVCCICRSPFVEPCTTRTCCHTFCYDCISRAIAVSRQCPIDRTPLSIRDLAPADPVVRNLVDELVVKCPQERLGCLYSCQRLLLPVHLRDTCEYVEFACPEAGCAQRILRKDLQNHVCQGVASKESGLKDQKPGDALSDSCQLHRNVKNAVAAGDVPQQRSASSSPSSDLATENAVLRLRLSALENVVHTLRSEIFAVKHALGPWYRPEVQLQLHDQDEAAQSSVEVSPIPTPYSSSHNVEANEVASTTEPSPSEPAADPSDISSYFPPAEEVANDAPSVSLRPRRARAITDAQQPYPAPLVTHVPTSTSPATPFSTFGIQPHAGHGHSAVYNTGPYATPGPLPGVTYTQGTPLPTTSPTTVSVPPLDPSTSLPDTLASLHSSLVTLAGALGALAAARGSESLRTADELRGLRAAMHALRMQVHDILTSRTHLTSQGPGAAVSTGDADTSEAAPLGMGTPSWTGYAHRPYGHFPVYPHPLAPPHLGVPPVLPTNITKL
ncbi:hypothetical protein BD414DRAFT_481157 [Trametes punicea]|nr:hypothetical protein BD414DRAFT_481157 [Trametes punicea]